MISKRALMPLTPCIKSLIWGGVRLKKIKRIENVENIAESWEVSIHKDGPSTFIDTSLNEIISEDELPYLVKFIDTADDLSIQVHPDDRYARKYENSLGKSECWVILDAADDAGIYLGFKKGVTREIFEEKINLNSDISLLLNFFPVKKGDFFFVPAGAVHAIGKNVFLCEVQQSSGITYRAWDWERVDKFGKKRELHLKKALDVLRFEEEFNQEANFLIKRNIFSSFGVGLLLDYLNFGVEVLVFIKDSQKVLALSQNRGAAIVVLSGKVKIERSGQEEELSAFQSMYLPLGEFSLGILTALTDCEVLYIV